MSNQKELILNNERIPGLIDGIKKYRDSGISTTDAPQKHNSNGKDGPSGGDGPDDKDGSSGGDGPDDEDGSNGEDGHNGDKYIPPAKYKPKQTKKDFLCFTVDEAKSFKINGNSDYEIKITSLIHDLSCFSVYKHPYSCALLYRTLLEISTRLVYERYASSVGRLYNESDLVGK